MKRLCYYFRVFAVNFKFSILMQLEYPTYLICWLIGTPIYYLSGIGLLVSVTQQFGSLGGYSGEQLVFLYGLGLVSQSFMITFFIQTWNMDRLVIHGEFDRMLLRPLNIVFQFLADYINLIGVVDMIPGFLIFFYGCHLVHFEWSLYHLLQLVMILIGAVMIRASLYMLVGSISFWAKGSSGMIQNLERILEKTTLYPISVYPTVIQLLFTFFIPVGFISFYPAAYLLGQDGRFSLPLTLSGGTFTVGVLMAIIAVLVFKRGFRRYESAGS